MSLGRCFAGHSLSHKLDMARRYGFQGIEVFYEDLVDLAESMPGGSSNHDNQLAAARILLDLCDERDLEIIALQPFMHYGALIDRDEHKRRVKEMDLFIQLAHILGTDLILLPSSFLGEKKVSGDLHMLVADMREIADLGLQESPPMRFAYEALCWGTHVDTWEASWDVVQLVNRDNFGVCLDTFNIAGRIFADPASATGCTSNCDSAIINSMNHLLSSVDVSKVFLVQVADAERLSKPLNTDHQFYHPDQPCRMSWSRNCRLFYGESKQGAYLPVQAILTTLVKGLGFTGWLSFEVFNRQLAEERKGVPEEMARRAAASWEKMVRDVGLQVDAPVERAAEPRMQAML
jgi:4-hydroxyphenylpyruvate dioxygenase